MQPLDKPLDLAALGSLPGMPGLTVAAGRSLAEAAAVCLEHCGHSEQTELVVTGWKNLTCILSRPPVDSQMLRTYGDMQEATEFGACAIAILLVKNLMHFDVMERSFKGTGFDYWIGDDQGLPFGGKIRLEVSGILRGSSRDVDERVKKKCRQTERSDTIGAGAMVFVVEFARPFVGVAKR